MTLSRVEPTVGVNLYCVGVVCMNIIVTVTILVIVNRFGPNNVMTMPLFIITGAYNSIDSCW